MAGTCRSFGTADSCLNVKLPKKITTGFMFLLRWHSFLGVEEAHDLFTAFLAETMDMTLPTQLSYRIFLDNWRSSDRDEAVLFGRWEHSIDIREGTVIPLDLCNVRLNNHHTSERPVFQIFSKLRCWGNEIADAIVCVHIILHAQSSRYFLIVHSTKLRGFSLCEHKNPVLTKSDIDTLTHQSLNLEFPLL